MISRCPHCGARQALLRGSGRYDCPACGGPLRLHNALALVAAFLFAPVLAGVAAGFVCDGPVCSGTTALALSVVLGVAAYIALMSVEKVT